MFDVIHKPTENHVSSAHSATTAGDYVSNYIGSKQKHLDWTWSVNPKGINSVFDAFSGAATLSYMYKSKGLKTIANDRLNYCHHIAKAIVENNSTLLTDSDIDVLLSLNAQAGTFVRDTFSGIFFGRGVHTLIDQYRANCDYLEGYKKDMALFALGNACISCTCGFGNFTAVSFNNTTPCTPSEFKERYRKNLEKVNSLVFDNGQQNRALNMNAIDILPHIQSDMVFFDTPYVTEFSVTNYEKAYHFVEGLMIYWEGLTIREDTKSKCYEINHETLTKENIYDFFDNLLKNAGHFPYWIISYRDHAYPTETEMKDIIASFGRSCQVESNYYQYSIAGKRTSASTSKEYLFICKKKDNEHLKSLKPLTSKYVIPNPRR